MPGVEGAACRFTFVAPGGRANLNPVELTVWDETKSGGLPSERRSGGDMPMAKSVESRWVDKAVEGAEYVSSEPKVSARDADAEVPEEAVSVACSARTRRWEGTDM